MGIFDIFSKKKSSVPPQKPPLDDKYADDPAQINANELSSEELNTDRQLIERIESIRKHQKEIDDKNSPLKNQPQAPLSSKYPNNPFTGK